ncbi:MAG: adenine phosphoribosyltransferase [Streptomycetaceae bacterium]|nr:MAG: adenine phosphoribosyltransferase [Streptomycetaceae bacterium]
MITLAESRELIREIPDYPLPGIRFQDLTPLLGHGEGFACVVQALEPLVKDATLIAGIEARGFIFAAALAKSLNLGFIPIRKAGKLPHVTIEESYGLEYGTDVLQIHADAFTQGSRVLLLDDVLATGGTVVAASTLISRLGGSIVGAAAVLEISGLGGRERFQEKHPNIGFDSLFLV